MKPAAVTTSFVLSGIALECSSSDRRPAALGLYRVWVALALADLALSTSDFEEVIRQGEIAEKLWAEYHLRSMYSKLDVHARAELARFWAWSNGAYSSGHRGAARTARRR